MKTSIIGYPRVGSLRELKFTTEKYFRGEISVEELQNTAKEIRKTQWTLQKNTGLDFIPSNDFSFYDMTLDTAVLFNIIPERYTKLGLSASLAPVHSHIKSGYLSIAIPDVSIPFGAILPKYFTSSGFPKSPATK